MSFAVFGALLIFLLRKAIEEFVFLVILAVCFPLDRSLLMVTPRYFAVSLHSKFLVVDIVVCAAWMPLVGDSQYFSFVGVV